VFGRTTNHKVVRTRFLQYPTNNPISPERQNMTGTEKHYLADGTEVKLGMRVKDYDAKYGTIPYQARNVEELTKVHVHGERETCNAWFHVLRDDNTWSTMDCSRMIAEGGKYDRA
jgi:hypothetical protein